MSFNIEAAINGSYISEVYMDFDISFNANSKKLYAELKDILRTTDLPSDEVSLEDVNFYDDELRITGSLYSTEKTAITAHENTYLITFFTSLLPKNERYVSSNSDNVYENTAVGVAIRVDKDRDGEKTFGISCNTEYIVHVKFAGEGPHAAREFENDKYRMKKIYNANRTKHPDMYLLADEADDELIFSVDATSGDAALQQVNNAVGIDTRNSVLYGKEHNELTDDFYDYLTKAKYGKKNPEAKFHRNVQRTVLNPVSDLKRMIEMQHSFVHSIAEQMNKCQNQYAEFLHTVDSRGKSTEVGVKPAVESRAPQLAVSFANLGYVINKGREYERAMQHVMTDYILSPKLTYSNNPYNLDVNKVAKARMIYERAVAALRGLEDDPHASAAGKSAARRHVKDVICNDIFPIARDLFSKYIDKEDYIPVIFARIREYCEKYNQSGADRDAATLRYPNGTHDAAVIDNFQKDFDALRDEFDVQYKKQTDPATALTPYYSEKFAKLIGDYSKALKRDYESDNLNRSIGVKPGKDKYIEPAYIKIVEALNSGKLTWDALSSYLHHSIPPLIKEEKEAAKALPVMSGIKVNNANLRSTSMPTPFNAENYDSILSSTKSRVVHQEHDPKLKPEDDPLRASYLNIDPSMLTILSTLEFSQFIDHFKGFFNKNPKGGKQAIHGNLPYGREHSLVNKNPVPSVGYGTDRSTFSGWYATKKEIDSLGTGDKFDVRSGNVFAALFDDIKKREGDQFADAFYEVVQSNESHRAISRVQERVNKILNASDTNYNGDIYYMLDSVAATLDQISHIADGDLLPTIANIFHSPSKELSQSIQEEEEYLKALVDLDKALSTKHLKSAVKKGDTTKVGDYVFTDEYLMRTLPRFITFIKTTIDKDKKTTVTQSLYEKDPNALATPVDHSKPGLTEQVGKHWDDKIKVIKEAYNNDLAQFENKTSFTDEELVTVLGDIGTDKPGRAKDILNAIHALVADAGRTSGKIAFNYVRNELADVRDKTRAIEEAARKATPNQVQQPAAGENPEQVINTTLPAGDENAVSVDTNPERDMRDEPEVLARSTNKQLVSEILQDQSTTDPSKN